MVEIYVLIMLTLGDYKAGTASAVAEFTSKERCENAGDRVMDAIARKDKNRYHIYYVCVQK